MLIHRRDPAVRPDLGHQQNDSVKHDHRDEALSRFAILGIKPMAKVVARRQRRKKPI